MTWFLEFEVSFFKFKVNEMMRLRRWVEISLPLCNKEISEVICCSEAHFRERSCLSGMFEHPALLSWVLFMYCINEILWKRLSWSVAHK